MFPHFRLADYGFLIELDSLSVSARPYPLIVDHVAAVGHIPPLALMAVRARPPDPHFHPFRLRLESGGVSLNQAGPRAPIPARVTFFKATRRRIVHPFSSTFAIAHDASHASSQTHPTI